MEEKSPFKQNATSNHPLVQCLLNGENYTAINNKKMFQDKTFKFQELDKEVGRCSNTNNIVNHITILYLTKNIDEEMHDFLNALLDVLDFKNDTNYYILARLACVLNQQQINRILNNKEVNKLSLFKNIMNSSTNIDRKILEMIIQSLSEEEKGKIKNEKIKDEKNNSENSNFISVISDFKRDCTRFYDDVIILMMKHGLYAEDDLPKAITILENKLKEPQGQQNITTEKTNIKFGRLIARITYIEKEIDQKAFEPEEYQQLAIELLSILEANHELSGKNKQEKINNYLSNTTMDIDSFSFYKVGELFNDEDNGLNDFFEGLDKEKYDRIFSLIRLGADLDKFLERLPDYEKKSEAEERKNNLKKARIDYLLKYDDEQDLKKALKILTTIDEEDRHSNIRISQIRKAISNKLFPKNKIQNIEDIQLALMPVEELLQYWDNTDSYPKEKYSIEQFQKEERIKNLIKSGIDIDEILLEVTDAEVKKELTIERFNYLVKTNSLNIENYKKLLDNLKLDQNELEKMNSEYVNNLKFEYNGEKRTLNEIILSETANSDDYALLNQPFLILNNLSTKYLKDRNKNLEKYLIQIAENLEYIALDKGLKETFLKDFIIKLDQENPLYKACYKKCNKLENFMACVMTSADTPKEKIDSWYQDLTDDDKEAIRTSFVLESYKTSIMECSQAFNFERDISNSLIFLARNGSPDYKAAIIQLQKLAEGKNIYQKEKLQNLISEICFNAYLYEINFQGNSQEEQAKRIEFNNLVEEIKRNEFFSKDASHFTDINNKETISKELEKRIKNEDYAYLFHAARNGFNILDLEIEDLEIKRQSCLILYEFLKAKESHDLTDPDILKLKEGICKGKRELYEKIELENDKPKENKKPITGLNGKELLQLHQNNLFFNTKRLEIEIEAFQRIKDNKNKKNPGKLTNWRSTITKNKAPKKEDNNGIYLKIIPKDKHLEIFNVFAENSNDIIELMKKGLYVDNETIKKNINEPIKRKILLTKLEFLMKNTREIGEMNEIISLLRNENKKDYIEKFDKNLNINIIKSLFSENTSITDFDIEFIKNTDFGYHNGRQQNAIDYLKLNQNQNKELEEILTRINKAEFAIRSHSLINSATELGA